jgi:hypothetical protein
MENEEEVTCWPVSVVVLAARTMAPSCGDAAGRAVASVMAEHSARVTTVKKRFFTAAG